MYNYILKLAVVLLNVLKRGKISRPGHCILERCLLIVTDGGEQY